MTTWNRLCLEVADETGWGFVNINLRPFYAEGSKTLAYETPSRSAGVRPTSSSGQWPPGRCSRASRAASRSWPARAHRTPADPFVGGQAAGLQAGRDGVGRGTDAIEPVRTPDTIVRSLAIGNPADGRYVVELVNETHGSVEAIEDEVTAAAIRDVARLEGIYLETAGGVTLAAAAAARRRGVIRPGDEVVALVTGNGLKTPTPDSGAR